MADVAAYYEQLEQGARPRPSRAEAPADIAKLLAKANCASCHGKNYTAPIDPTYPKLAGQHADYVRRAQGLPDRPEPTWAATTRS